MDALLIAVIAFTQLILGGMGVYVSLRPPEKRYHWYWIGAFAFVGLLGIGMTWWVSVRAENSQNSTTARINEAVTAATNANVAATNANTAATNAQQEVKAARDDERKAKDELARLISKSSTETNTAILKLGSQTDASIKAMGTQTQESLKAISPLATPPRRIPTENRNEIIRFLSVTPATASIGVIGQDAEAYRFAEDWSEVLTSAGWKVEGINTIMLSGAPLVGMTVGFHGEPVAENQVFSVSTTEPAGKLAAVIQGLKIKSSGQRSLSIAEGKIVIRIGSKPPAD
jgi:hypothetical protein